MSIQSEITLLQNTKDGLRTAIMEKGVVVGANELFSNYPTRISQITTQSGTFDESLKKLLDGSYTSYSIPEGTSMLRQNAFNSYTSLTSITIPTTITFIGDHAFYNCTSLNRVNISDLSAWCKIVFSYDYEYSSNPLSLAHKLYLNGTLITELVIPSSITVVNDLAFYGNTSLTSVVIPDSVELIGELAFSNCNNIKTVEIGEGVTDILSNAFAWCSKLTSITIKATTPPQVENNTFSQTNNCPIYVPAEYVEDYKTAWPTYASRIQAMPTYKARLTLTDNSVVTIDDDGRGELSPEELSLYQSTLRELEVFSCVDTIADSACERFTALTTVTLNNSVTTLENFAFNRCTSLTSFTAPGLTSWGTQALCQSAMTYYEIPEGITYTFRTFSESPYLEEVIFPEGFLELGPNTFYQCTSLTSINIPSSVTSILDYAFYGCTSLTSVVIPDSVELIGELAFSNCNNIKTVEIGEGVTDIGTNAFAWCSKLTSITIKATTPPYLIYNPLDNTNDCPIYVPAAYVEDYKLAWSLYAPRIQAIPVPSKMVITYDDGLIETISVPEDHICEYEEISYPTVVMACDFDELYLSQHYPEDIRTITICENITQIDLVLYGCTGLESITIEAATPPQIWGDIFNSAETNDCPIYVPADSLQDYLDDPEWGNYSHRLEAIPEPVVPKFVRISKTTDATDGKYLIVDMDSNKALNASLITSTTGTGNGINNFSSGNTISVTIEQDGTITANAENLNAAAYYDATNQKLYWEDGNNTKYYLSQRSSSSSNFKYSSTTSRPTATITPYKGDANYITLKQSYFLGGDGSNTVSWYSLYPNATQIGRIAMFKYVEE